MGECRTSGKHPVKLSRAGYSQNTILRLHPTFAGLEYETGDLISGLLSRRSGRFKSESLLQKRVIFVVGATGSGRTTLAQNWQQPERCASRKGGCAIQPVHNSE